MDRDKNGKLALPARRWRLAKKGTGLKGCRYRQDCDENGRAFPVACADIKGTFESCRSCK